MSKTRPAAKSGKTIARRPARRFTRKNLRRSVKGCTEDLRTLRELVDEGNRLGLAIARYPLLIWAGWAAVTTGGDTLTRVTNLIVRLLGGE